MDNPLTAADWCLMVALVVAVWALDVAIARRRQWAPQAEDGGRE